MRNVVVVGAGGLGCPALYELAPALAGRARVTIVDDDLVDVSNLQRQILHRSADVGRPKVDSARDALARRWPRLAVETVRARVDAGNVAALVAAGDVVLDGTDNFAAKFLLNDACVRARVPLVHGAALGLAAQVLSVVPGGACYRCLFEDAPPEVPSCAEAGVLGAVCGVAGSIMAGEALAILDGKPQLASTLLIFDGARGEQRRVRFRPRPGCAACDASGERRIGSASC